MAAMDRRASAPKRILPDELKHLFSIASVQLQECVAPISRLEFMGGSTLAERGGKGSGEFFCELGPTAIHTRGDFSLGERSLSCGSPG